MPPAAPAPLPGSLGRNLRAALTLGLAAAVALSIATYFSALSQYATADQSSTAARLVAFLIDVRSIKLSDGSLISDLLVAHPAQWLDQALRSIYRPYDPIVWDIQYTPLLPFAAAQVVVALALIAYLVALVVRLAGSGRRRIDLFLFALLIVMNFPMLKGIAKVVKYDILSTLFSAIAIVLYIAYRTRGSLPRIFFGRYVVAAVAVFCGFAYLEKDTSLSTVLLICTIELMLIPFVTAGLLRSLAAAARFVIVFAVGFAAACIALVPKIWFEPAQFLSLFGSIPLYVVNIPPAVAAIPVVFLALVYVGVPLARDRGFLLARKLEPAAIGLYSAVAIVVVLLGASAIVFQQNVLFDPTITGNDLDVDALHAQSIYVARPIAYSAITTLDHSALLQHLKIFWSMVRTIFYTLPEITLLLIVAAAPLFLTILRRDKSACRGHTGTLTLVLLFPVAMLAAFSIADLPFEPKYLVLVSLLLTIYGVYVALVWLERLAPALSVATQAIVAIVMAITALSAAPSYLPYKNILRDRVQENAASLDMNRYIWWTWPGWGENSYPVSRYIEKNIPGPTTVAFDYWAPFYAAPGLTWVNFDFYKCQTVDQLDAVLQKMKAQSVDFLLLSKNMSNRQWCINLVLRKMRDKAVFVDVQQGIEYGWLFRFSDVWAAFKK